MVDEIKGHRFINPLGYSQLTSDKLPVCKIISIILLITYLVSYDYFCVLLLSSMEIGKPL